MTFKAIKTKNSIVLLSNADYDRLHKLERWNIQVNNKSKLYTTKLIYLDKGLVIVVPLSHWVLGKPPQGQVVDHINRWEPDCRRENLRFATHQQNSWNSWTTNYKTGYKGTAYRENEPGTKKYISSYSLLGKRKTIGMFRTAEEAGYAYHIKAQALHGEFYRNQWDGRRVKSRTDLDGTIHVYLDLTVQEPFVPEDFLLHSSNTSGYIGVHPDDGLWYTSIFVDGRAQYLGTFKTPLEGAIVRNEYIREHGLKHKLNPIPEDAVVPQKGSMMTTVVERAKSVLNGKDNEAIEILLSVHCDADDPAILDCTYNTGKMWRGTEYKPHRMDIDASFEVDTVADFTKMPFDSATFDVVVFDPPHLPTHAASENSSKIWERSYGITATGAGREGDNVSGMFKPFLLEAKRVLRPGGIVLAKIADLVHNHRYQWQQVDFVQAVREVGLTPCDLLIKCDPNAGNLTSSKWKTVKHLRKAHCYWIVVRNSNRCESKKGKTKAGNSAVLTDSPLDSFSPSD